MPLHGYPSWSRRLRFVRQLDTRMKVHAFRTPCIIVTGHVEA